MSPLVRSARLRALFVVALGVAVALPALPAAAASPTAAPTASPTVSVSPTGSAVPTVTAAPSGTPSTSPSVASPIVPKGQAGCSPVSFYGIRGGGEAATTQDGLGAALGAYRARLAAALGAGRVASYAAAYPATAVLEPASADSWRSAAVTASVEAGAATVAADLAALVSECPSTSIVLGGDDLGALIVRDALASLTDASPDAAGRVASVILVGDPALHWADPGVLVGGGSPWAQGVLAAAGAVTELPASVPAVHVCHAGDVVCQSTGTVDRHRGYDADADSAAVVVEVSKNLRLREVSPAYAARATVVAPASARIGAAATFSVVVTGVGAIPNPRAGTLTVTLSGSALEAGGTATGQGWECRASVCTRAVAAASLAPGLSLPPITVTVTPRATTRLLVSARMSDVPLGGVESYALSWASAAVSQPEAARPLARVTLVEPGVRGAAARWSVALTNTGHRPTTAAVRVDLEISGSYDENPRSASGQGWVCVARRTCVYTPALAVGATSTPLLVDTRPDATSVEVSVRQGDNGGQGGDGRATLTVPTTLRSTGEAALAPGLSVALTSSATDGRAHAGSTVTWSATVVNTSTTTPSSGTVTANVWTSQRDGVGDVAPKASGENWVCSDGQCAWTGPALAPGASTTSLRFAQDVDGGTPWIRAGVAADDVSDKGLAPGSADVRLPVAASGQAHLQPVLVASRKVPGLAGDKASWKAHVVNSGAAASTGAASIAFTLPGPATDWSLSGQGWACEGVICTSAALLAPGASSTPISIVRRATSRLTGAVSVTAQAGEAGIAAVGSRSVSSTVTFGSGSTRDLAVMSSGFAAPVASAAPARTTVTVRNVGSEPFESASLATGYAPDGWQVVHRGSGWDCPGWQGAVCVLTTPLAPGAVSPPLTVEALPPIGVDYPAGWWTDQRITVSSQSPDDDPGNDAVDLSFVVADPAVDLAPELRTEASRVSLGKPLVTTAVVRNHGWRPSTGPIKITYMAGAHGSSSTSTTTASGEGWTCVAKTRVCTTTAAAPPGAALPPVILRTVITMGSGIFTEVPPGAGVQVQLSAVSDQVPADNTADVQLGLDEDAADLFGALTPTTAGVAPGEDLTAELALTNVGADPLADRTVVDLVDPVGFRNDTLVGTGTGWTCRRLPRVSPLRCVTDADVEPSGALPVLTVRGRLAGSQSTGLYDAVRMTARWTNAGDLVRNNDLSGFVTSIAPRRADLIPVLVGPARPVAAGTTSAPTTTPVSVSVVNAGPTATSGEVRVGWYDAGPEGQPVIAATGRGWSCSSTKLVCRRTTPLAPGEQAPPITLTVRNTPGTVGSRSAVEVWVADAQDDAGDPNELSLAYPVY